MQCTQHSRHPFSTMRSLLLILGLLAALVSHAAATALTFKLGSSETSCFYCATKKDAEKIAFYFAVRGGPPRMEGIQNAGADGS